MKDAIPFTINFISETNCDCMNDDKLYIYEADNSKTHKSAFEIKII